MQLMKGLLLGGELVVVYIEILDTKGGVGEAAWLHKRIQKMKISGSLSNKKQEIFDGLKYALIAYKDAGVLSKTTEYGFLLEY